jgi:protein-S-isoprenylcysteine O-methyltransferase Ste14
LWAIVFLPVALLVIQRGVIEREERYLERKFGEEYLSYKAGVIPNPVKEFPDHAVWGHQW